MADTDGKRLVDLYIGKARDPGDSGSGGQYVCLAGGKMAYLVDQTFSGPDSSPGDWIQKQIVDIPAESVRQVDCLDPADGATLYSVARPAKGEAPAIQGLTEGQKPKSATVDTLFDALSSLRAEDVTAAEDRPSGGSDERLFRYFLYDGRVVTVRTGNANGQGEDATPFIRLAVAFAEGHDTVAAAVEETGASAEAPADKDGAAGKEEERENVDAETVARQDARLKPWTYTLAKWTFDSFAPSLDRLLEEKQAAESATQQP
jgi:hypothetical protein